jgi:hypothetical protein
VLRTRLSRRIFALNKIYYNDNNVIVPTRCVYYYSRRTINTPRVSVAASDPAVPLPALHNNDVLFVLNILNDRSDCGRRLSSRRFVRTPRSARCDARKTAYYNNIIIYYNNTRV